jgi:hypothetical protein
VTLHDATHGPNLVVVLVEAVGEKDSPSVSVDGQRLSSPYGVSRRLDPVFCFVAASRFSR